jgi:hypothetical protein
MEFFYKYGIKDLMAKNVREVYMALQIFGVMQVNIVIHLLHFFTKVLYLHLLKKKKTCNCPTNLGSHFQGTDLNHQLKALNIDLKVNVNGDTRRIEGEEDSF